MLWCGEYNKGLLTLYTGKRRYRLVLEKSAVVVRSKKDVGETHRPIDARKHGNAFAE